MRSIILLIAIIFIASCDKVDRSEIHIDTKEVMYHLKKELERENISYLLSEDKETLFIDNDDIDKASALYKKAFYKVLPPNRHSSFPSKIQKEIKTKLNEHGYQYKTVCHDNVEWIVWGQENSKEIETLIEQVIIDTIAIVDIGDDITSCEKAKKGT